jgi:Fe-S-cluster containining protein
VWVNQAEIEAMAEVVGVDVGQFERDFVRKVGIRRSLLEYANGDCVFFDAHQRRCLVYDVRPRQCRTWPFWASNLKTPAAWAEMAEGCPGANQGPRYSIEEIRQLLAVLRV